MQLLRSVFADRVQVKIALFTFFTVFLVFLVFTAWQQDTWTTAKSLFESLEDTATSENIDFSNSGFKISNETAHATPISNNTRPAVVAAGMQPEDLYWLDEVVQECVSHQSRKQREADRLTAGMYSLLSSQTGICLHI